MVEVLGGKAVREGVGERSGGGDCAAEGVVSVLCNGGARGVEVAGDVPVIVIARNIRHAVYGKVKQSADAASSLQRAGEVFAPIVVDCRNRAVRAGNDLLYEIPIVVEVCVRGGGREFPDAASGCVVGKSGDGDAVGGNRGQAAGCVVGVGEYAVGGQVAVGVVCGIDLTQRRGAAERRLARRTRPTFDGGVLVETIGRVDVGFGC